MKLIIDIPEQMYLNAKADLLCGGAILVEAIKNGIPYEERTQGEWIFRNGVTCCGYYKCNKCGEVERAEKNFCSNCGASMKKGGAE